MKAVIQRAADAKVSVGGDTKGRIGRGFLILLGVARGDGKTEAEILAAKIAHLRLFPDEKGKFQYSLPDVGGSVLVISNFTLYADCRRGRRPEFTAAAGREQASELYAYFCGRLKEEGIADVQRGVFGADMQVELTNDGPVTIVMDTDDLQACERPAKTLPVQTERGNTI